MEIILTIIAFLYASTGIIATIGYIPTIRDLIKKIASANIHSYVIWTFCSCITFFYALLVISDLLLEIVTGLNFASCAIILILALKLKYKKQWG
ncbi:hypothetical protein J4446_00415 [Candidatus Woesearchaeota archaeon]|nr:hypothetical protein [Candidatus Woesearchaeota archaeon]